MASGKIQKRTSIIARERIGTSETLPYVLEAGANHGFSFAISKAGYAAVAVGGCTGSGTGKCTFADSYIANNSTAMLYMSNPTSTAQTITALTMDILYVSNS